MINSRYFLCFVTVHVEGGLFSCYVNKPEPTGIINKGHAIKYLVGYTSGTYRFTLK